MCVYYRTIDQVNKSNERAGESEQNRMKNRMNDNRVTHLFI